jgi:hypothetical protein
MTLTGSSGSSGTLASLIIVNRVSQTGSASVPINYSASQNYGTATSSLVE